MILVLLSSLDLGVLSGFAVFPDGDAVLWSSAWMPIALRSATASSWIVETPWMGQGLETLAQPGSPQLHRCTAAGEGEMDIVEHQ